MPKVETMPVTRVEDRVCVSGGAVVPGGSPRLVVGLKRTTLLIAETVLFFVIMDPATVGGLCVTQGEAQVPSVLAVGTLSSGPVGTEHRTIPDGSASSKGRTPVPSDISPWRHEKYPEQFLRHVRCRTHNRDVWNADQRILTLPLGDPRGTTKLSTAKPEHRCAGKEYAIGINAGSANSNSARQSCPNGLSYLEKSGYNLQGVGKECGPYVAVILVSPATNGRTGSDIQIEGAPAPYANALLAIITQATLAIILECYCMVG